MRRHAKASTAGLNQRQARDLGRFLRGVDAARGPALGGEGSGAPAGGGAAPVRRLALPAVLFVLLIGVMALVVSPASATKIHPFKETFGSAAQPAFGSPRGIAIDQSSGDVLVMDAEAPDSIKRYNADGTPDDFGALGTNVIDGEGTGNCATVPADCDETPQNGLIFAAAAQSQIAVDNSGTATDGNIYVTHETPDPSAPNLIDIFSEEGEYLGQLSESSAGPFSDACGVAVDSAGAVYVGDLNGGIHKFVPTGNPPVDADSTATFTSVGFVCALAAGAGPTAGFLFAGQLVGPISKLDSGTGELKYTVSPDNNTTVAVDPGTGHVLAATGQTVKEFDASGADSAIEVSTTTRPSTLEGLAVRAASGDLYLSRSSESHLEVLGSLVAIPAVTTTTASPVQATGATLNGTVNPDGVELTECFFEYGETASYGSTAACEQSPAAIGTGTSDVPVSADVSGLEAGTEYHFRLVASNPNGTVEGDDVTLQSAGPVLVDAWTAAVVRTEATIAATIRPEGEPTTYRIEWGPDTGYGSSTGELSVGSDSSPHTVSRTITGLQPGRTYHWRVVVTNSAAVIEGIDHAFTTYAPIAYDTSCPNQANRIGSSAALPDCRAYEMVSPVNKNGGDIVSRCTGLCYRAEYIQSTPDANKLTYSSATAFGDALSSLWSNQYIATRGAEGWTTHSITPPTTQSGTIETAGFGSPYQAFTSDLSLGWLRAAGEVPQAPGGVAGKPNIYMHDNLSDAYSLVAAGETALVKGFSRDGSLVVYETDKFGGSPEQVYQLSEGVTERVSILPGGTPDPGSARVGSGSENSYETRGGNVAHAVSEDGSRIFWTTRSDFFGGPGTIYVRIDGQTTVPVSESVSAAAARFWAASASGSDAVFTIGADLYRFDVDTETPTHIAGEVSGVAGASDDLSYIYFVSKEDLATGATAGAGNLYVDHEGAISLIATLSEEDLSAKFSPVAVAPLWRGSRVTPDGRHIAFMSDRSLTGFDNTDAVNGKADREVFLYDAPSGELTCASCNPSGARPAGEILENPYQVKDQGSNPFTTLQAAAWIPTWQHEQYATRPLADDGNRLFFNSFDPLVPQDTNGEQDVYQWEAEGSGDCATAPGCISLITTGESSEDAEFVDASPDGSSVFFRTRQSVVPADPGSVDLYVARVDGGFPPPADPIPCLGDACQSPPQEPSHPTPSSATFKGAGNPSTGRSCSAPSKRAVRLSRLAKRLRHVAGQGSSKRSAQLRKRSARLAAQAKRLQKRASRCRRANRGARP